MSSAVDIKVVSDRSKRILFIDDDIELCRMMDQFLSRFGYEVITAGGGESALKKIELSPVDLVITDLAMPRKDGFDVICDLKEKYPEIKIIAITGGHPTWHQDRDTYLDVAYKLGADRCFEKPFDQDQFVKVIADVFDRKV